MPVHNWKTAPLGLFHHFHQHWSCAICDGLNGGLLPSGFYALIEQHAANVIPDVLTLQRRSGSGKPSHRQRGVALAEAPPKTSMIHQASLADVFAAKANKIVVHDSLGDVVSVIELVSPGNKHSRLAVRKFLNKSVDLIQNGVHLLIVDLFPPSPRDPQGIHGQIWSEIDEGDFTLPRGKRLTLVSYCSGSPLTAFIEPLAVGDRLPKMPVFLDSQTYVPLPLEETYSETWKRCPAEFREAILERQK